jgi:hypothetical protein
MLNELSKHERLRETAALDELSNLHTKTADIREAIYDVNAELRARNTAVADEHSNLSAKPNNAKIYEAILNVPTSLVQQCSGVHLTTTKLDAVVEEVRKHAGAMMEFSKQIRAHNSATLDELSNLHTKTADIRDAIMNIGETYPGLHLSQRRLDEIMNEMRKYRGAMIGELSDQMRVHHLAVVDGLSNLGRDANIETQPSVHYVHLSKANLEEVINEMQKHNSVIFDDFLKQIRLQNAAVVEELSIMRTKTDTNATSILAAISNIPAGIGEEHPDVHSSRPNLKDVINEIGSRHCVVIDELSKVSLAIREIFSGVHLSTTDLEEVIKGVGKQNNALFGQLSNTMSNCEEIHEQTRATLDELSKQICTHNSIAVDELSTLKCNAADIREAILNTPAAIGEKYPGVHLSKASLDDVIKEMRAHNGVMVDEFSNCMRTCNATTMDTLANLHTKAVDFREAISNIPTAIGEKYPGVHLSNVKLDEVVNDVRSQNGAMLDELSNRMRAHSSSVVDELSNLRTKAADIREVAANIPVMIGEKYPGLHVSKANLDEVIKETRRQSCAVIDELATQMRSHKKAVLDEVSILHTVADATGLLEAISSIPTVIGEKYPGVHLSKANLDDVVKEICEESSKIGDELSLQMQNTEKSETTDALLDELSKQLRVHNCATADELSNLRTKTAESCEAILNIPTAMAEQLPGLFKSSSDLREVIAEISNNNATFDELVSKLRSHNSAVVEELSSLRTKAADIHKAVLKKMDGTGTHLSRADIDEVISEIRKYDANIHGELLKLRKPAGSTKRGSLNSKAEQPPPCSPLGSPLESRHSTIQWDSDRNGWCAIFPDKLLFKPRRYEKPGGDAPCDSPEGLFKDEACWAGFLDEVVREYVCAMVQGKKLSLRLDISMKGPPQSHGDHHREWCDALKESRRALVRRLLVEACTAQQVSSGDVHVFYNDGNLGLLATFPDIS